MPCFHFHIRSASGALVRGEAGMYLPNIDAARAQARLVAQEFSAEHGRSRPDYLGAHFEIVSADGQPCQPLWIWRAELGRANEP